jgi:hypothetical protein
MGRCSYNVHTYIHTCTHIAHYSAKIKGQKRLKNIKKHTLHMMINRQIRVKTHTYIHTYLNQEHIQRVWSVPRFARIKRHIDCARFRALPGVRSCHRGSASHCILSCGHVTCVLQQYLEDIWPVYAWKIFDQYVLRRYLTSTCLEDIWPVCA